MEITRPTLIVNKNTCLRNIEIMLEKAKRHHLRFRPHFKTHQSIVIGRWFRDFCIKEITVSSVQMAKYFADDGWKDITIAIPFNVLETDELNTISPDTKINLTVDNLKTVEIIGKKIKRETDIYIEINTGYNRTGISSTSINRISEIQNRIVSFPHLHYKGFLTHSGHTYQSKSKHEIQNIHFDTLKKINDLKSYFSKSFPEIEISIGDTPACSASENFTGVTEIRPGNFVFYDLMQHDLGACNIDDIAIRMFCPVISKQPQRNEVVIYGGAVHFSKDWIRNTDGKELFGRVILKKGEVSELLDTTNYLCRLSQEHGVIRMNPKVFRQIEIGDVLEIVPVHACLTADAMGCYFTKDNAEIEMMPRV